MVKKSIITLSAACLAGLAASCSTFDFGGMLAAGSSVQDRYRNSMEFPDRDSHIEIVPSPTDSYRFIVATDLHIRTDEWGKVGRFLTRVEEEGFSLNVWLGDFMRDTGSSLERLADSIRAHGKLCVTTAIGNHDVYRDGYQRTYRETFGATCYSFRVEMPGAHDLFIILDSANGTLGNDQFRWLQATLSGERGTARNCYIFTHANFFSPASYMDVITTYPVEEQMKLLDLFARQRVTAVFTGHSHVRDQTTVRGVRYITTGSWCDGKRKGEYCEAECTADGKLNLRFRSVE